MLDKAGPSTYLSAAAGRQVRLESAGARLAYSSGKMMVQTDREVRRARLDELRQVREELVRAGGFKVDPSKDSGDALAEAWIEPREGPGLAGGGAAAGRLRERLGAARRGGDAAGSGG